MEIDTHKATSAGGVTYRQHEDQIEVALIAVGENNRWQLPKGTLRKDETAEEAALREVQEETGIRSQMIAPIDRIEYWFYGSRGSKRVRYHKFVDFFLMCYESGDVNEHDDEVNEARWVEITQAEQVLAFESERRIVKLAHDMITNPGSQTAPAAGAPA